MSAKPRSYGDEAVRKSFARRLQNGGRMDGAVPDSPRTMLKRRLVSERAAPFGPFPRAQRGPDHSRRENAEYR